MSDTKRPKAYGELIGYEEVNRDLPVEMTAGATISVSTKPIAVYIKDSDGECYKTDADFNDERIHNFVGFAVTDGADGSAFTVQTHGVVRGFTGLDAGKTYYLSGTAGAIVTTAGTYEKMVGIAISATELWIAPWAYRGLTKKAQTITGIKTFGSIPVLPALDPTTINQATRKDFVDKILRNVIDPISIWGATTFSVKGVSGGTVYTVPAGKTAVLTHVNVKVAGRYIQVKLNGGTFYSVNKEGNDGNQVFKKNIRIYVDTGGEIEGVDSSNTTNALAIGYLVPNNSKIIPIIVASDYTVPADRIFVLTYMMHNDGGQSTQTVRIKGEFEIADSRYQDAAPGYTAIPYFVLYEGDTVSGVTVVAGTILFGYLIDIS